MKPQIKIEHNIKMPSKGGKNGGLTDALRQLNIGDSFLYPKSRTPSIFSSIRPLKIKVATRRIDDKTIRVWRIK